MSISTSLQLDDGWDRTFLNLSSKTAEPFCKIWHLLRYRLIAPLEPGKFENCNSRIQEIAKRVCIGLGALLGAYLTYTFPLPILSGTLLLGASSKLLRLLGFTLQKEGFTHVRGAVLEKELEKWQGTHYQLKIMNWNLCGIGGGMSLDHGGVPPWQNRFKKIVEIIRKENSDLVVLQEVYDTALGEALIQEFENEYAHFYFHLGPNFLGSVGGVMIFSKCAPYHFSHQSFKNNDWTLNRGFASLDIKASPDDEQPVAQILGTHLINGDQEEDKEKRAAQVGEIVNHITKQTFAKPTFVAGDFNIERDQKEGKIFATLFHFGYQGKDPTCTNRLVAQWDLKPPKVYDELIDNIFLVRSRILDRKLPVVDGGVQFKCTLGRAFDQTYNTQKALSDHQPLILETRIPIRPA